MQPRNARRHLAVAGVGVIVLSGLMGCAGPAPPGSVSPVNVTANNLRYARGGNQATDAVQKTFRAEKVARLRLNESTGTIEIVPALAGVDEIHIQATRIVTGNSPVEKLKPLLARIQATAVLEGDTLVVQANHPQDAFTNGISASFSVDYVLSVPPRLAYDLFTGGGEVKLRGITGGGAIRSNYGNVTVTEAGGAMDLSTSSGEISVEETQRAISVKAHTDYGNVTLKNIGGAIDASTASGSITVNQARDAKNLTLHSDAGDIELDAVGGIVDATTRSGQILLSHSFVYDHLFLHSDFGNIQATAVNTNDRALNVELSTTNGSIDFQGDASVMKLISSFGSIKAEPTAALTLRSADLTTDNGSVDLTLASSVSARINAKTDNGNLDLGDNAPNDGSVSESRSRMLGSGIAPVRLISHFGNVRLHIQ